MDKQEVTARIAGIFAQEFEIAPERITPQAHLFDDLGLDSLDRVEVMVALQEEFSIQAQNTREARSIRTIGDLCEFVFHIINGTATPEKTKQPV